MPRDHLLGWPPALLALEPEVKPSLRTPTREKLSPYDEHARRLWDERVTAGLRAYRPARERPAEAQIAPAPEIRIRPRHRVWLNADLYRLIDGVVHYWRGTLFGESCWRPAIVMRNWDFLIPATEDQLAYLPPSALE